jgi:hypothetical protein
MDKGPVTRWLSITAFAFVSWTLPMGLLFGFDWALPSGVIFALVGGSLGAWSWRWYDKQFR